MKGSLDVFIDLGKVNMTRRECKYDRLSLFNVGHTVGASLEASFPYVSFDKSWAEELLFDKH